MPKHRHRSILLLVFLCLLLGGCESIAYYHQSIRGHLCLMSQREPIEQLLADPGVDPETARLLAISVEAREFAELHLALPDEGSYESFVQLQTEFVTWNVVATEEFSVEPKTWCFPVAGCVSYRGYYEKADAEAYATGLMAKDASLDVALSGATAYSTLGWFDDPVLSSMLLRGDLALVETLFHELAHQRLYVADDSEFNEAFATAVGVNGVRAWLQSTAAERLPAYEQYLTRRVEFLRLVDETADELRELYESDAPIEQKRVGKRDAFSVMRERYAAMKTRWGGYNGYDRWFERDLNNAHLAMVSTYWKLVPEFERWLRACEGDFSRFYRAMEKLSDLENTERHSAVIRTAECVQ